MSIPLRPALWAGRRARFPGECAAVLGFGLLCAHIALSGQAPNAPPPRLVQARSLTCSFTVMATGTWRDGTAEAAVKPASLSVAFHSVDTQDGTAEAVADSGKSHITVRVLGQYLHLMQMDPYGALYVTTVFSHETREGKLQAVHTRHEFTPVSLPGLTSRPEQYVGECEVTSK
jgi:hypothetical protein